MDVIAFAAVQPPAAIIVTEWDKDYCRDAGVLLANTTAPKWGVLGRVTATGKYVNLAPAANDGSQNAAGVAYDTATAAVGVDDVVTVLARGPMILRQDMLVFPNGTTAPQIAAAIAQLTALGIVTRIPG